MLDLTNFSFIDSATTNAQGQDTLDTYRFRFNKEGSYFMIQPYLSWKHERY